MLPSVCMQFLELRCLVENDNYPLVPRRGFQQGAPPFREGVFRFYPTDLSKIVR